MLPESDDEDDADTAAAPKRTTRVAELCEALRQHRLLWRCEGPESSRWTLPEIVYAVRDGAERHRLPNTAVSWICALLSSVLPQGNCMPDSWGVFRRVLRSSVPAEHDAQLSVATCGNRDCGLVFGPEHGTGALCPECAAPRFTLQGGTRVPARTTSLYTVAGAIQVILSQPDVALARQTFDRHSLLAPAGFVRSEAGMAAMRHYLCPDNPASVSNAAVHEAYQNRDLLLLDGGGDGKSPFTRRDHVVGLVGARCRPRAMPHTVAAMHALLTAPMSMLNTVQAVGRPQQRPMQERLHGRPDQQCRPGRGESAAFPPLRRTGAREILPRRPGCETTRRFDLCTCSGAALSTPNAFGVYDAVLHCPALTLARSCRPGPAGAYVAVRCGRHGHRRRRQAAACPVYGVGGRQPVLQQVLQDTLSQRLALVPRVSDRRRVPRRHSLLRVRHALRPCSVQA